jgi:hypothetical protein
MLLDGLCYECVRSAQDAWTRATSLTDSELEALVATGPPGHRTEAWKALEREHQRRQSAQEPASGLAVLGVSLLVLGFVVLAGGLIMDTGVDTALGRIVNLGLMNDRLGVLILGATLSVVGAVLVAADHARRR